jgi:hypothetical protein
MAPLDMTDWAREKLGNVLEVLAHIADIAKDPETPPWYKRNLRQHVHRGLGDGLKLLLWSYDRTEEWDPEAIKQPTEHGTLGLAALLNSMNIAHDLLVEQPAVDPDDNTDREPPNPPGAPQRLEAPWASPVRQAILRHAAQTLADHRKRLSDAETRLLAWIVYHLCISEYEDIALLAPAFLGSDIGLTKSEGEAALRGLIENKLVEPVPELEGIELRRLALRIVVDGLNDRRHRPSVH